MNAQDQFTYSTPVLPKAVRAATWGQYYARNQRQLRRDARRQQTTVAKLKSK